MPAAAAVARVAELQTMLQAVNGRQQVAQATSTQTNFATALSAAQGTTAPAAPFAAPGPSAPTPFGAEIDAAAARHGIDPALLKGLVRQESGFNPSARSSAGAAGLTQLMPGTARELGVTDPTDPAQALEGGAKYLRQQLDRFGGDVAKALAAYNAGPGAVQKYGGVPPYAETQKYVAAVQRFAAEYRGEAPVATAPASALPTPTGSLSYSTT